MRNAVKFWRTNRQNAYRSARTLEVRDGSQTAVLPAIGRSRKQPPESLYLRVEEPERRDYLSVPLQERCEAERAPERYSVDGGGERLRASTKTVKTRQCLRHVCKRRRAAPGKRAKLPFSRSNTEKMPRLKAANSALHMRCSAETAAAALQTPWQKQNTSFWPASLPHVPCQKLAPGGGRELYSTSERSRSASLSHALRTESAPAASTSPRNARETCSLAVNSASPVNESSFCLHASAVRISLGRQ